MRWGLMLLFLGALIGGARANTEPSDPVPVASQPRDVESYLALRDELAKTPEGGAAMFLLAMMTYVQDKSLGTTFFTIALDRSRLAESPRGYKGFRPDSSLDYFLRQLEKAPYLARSYVAGTKPEENYDAVAPFVFQFSRNKFSVQQEDLIKVFVDCGGADTPRPLTLKRNQRGLWKVKEYSSVFVGIRSPGLPPDDDL